MLKGKKILLGITGSIAAYKAAILVRSLIKEGAQVKIIMTPLAKEFITPLTLATLSKNPILVDFFNPENGDWNSHVDLGLWADAYVIAPATANTMAKMAHGIADNLLLTSYLSARCPIFIAPAMDLDMFQHKSTQRNLEVLTEDGVIIIEPSSGELASGLEGKGRMEEPEVIVSTLKHFFEKKKPNLKNKFVGKKVLLTAGPTYEAIDPVRFIGNRSSGKMGYALAQNLANCGCHVVLVSGPTSLSLPHKNVELISVTSAAEMYDACIRNFNEIDIAILAAAVADYTPKEVHDQKLKRKSAELALELKATTDIAAELGKLKTDKQLLIGFALESEHGLENAKRKRVKKNLDAIVLNSLSDKGAGFETDTNKISIIDANNKISNFELKSKTEVANDIINYIETLL